MSVKENAAEREPEARKTTPLESTAPVLSDPNHEVAQRIQGEAKVLRDKAEARKRYPAQFAELDAVIAAQAKEIQNLKDSLDMLGDSSKGKKK